MWCARCQQHVAAIVGDADGVAVCAECGEAIDAFADLAGVHLTNVTPSTKSTRRDQTAEAISPRLPNFGYSRARLDHIARRLDALGKLAQPDEQASAIAKSATANTPDRSVLRAWIARIGLFCGLSTLTCGIALAVWSLFGDQALLWKVGLPTALVGQTMLLAALASQWEYRGRPSAKSLAVTAARETHRKESRATV
ncbi:MAG: hypothetical protein SGJ19_20650 [Planctomycetia bacterium]|nr:hypothetical protein [Planctomycetia bacterium]